VVAFEHESLDEGFLQSVETSNIKNQLGDRMRVLRQERLGERGDLVFSV
jgi:hypothetical protein